ncbi:MAG TPA: nuclear transport factor 2 family protein [Sphingomicrobium sp.]|nr:nuclear transport factor 2 family protein [Sphingomicrobium sp.]
MAGPGDTVLAVLLAVSSPALASGAGVQAGGTTPLAVEARAAAAVVDAFHAALRSGDTDAALAMLADDVLIFEGGKVERSKPEYAAHHLAADAAFSKAVSSVLTERTAGASGNIAWVASEGRTRGEYRGRTIDRTSAETMILRRAGDGWKIIHIHWSGSQ